MARIFTLLSAIAVVMILLAGGSTYWFLQTDIKQAKHDGASAFAKGISLGISSQLNILQQSIDGFAQMPEVISALESKDEALIKNTANKLETLIPLALKIRLLPTDISEVDESATPHMGFADLEMIRNTLSQKQKPTIQGQGEHRHLAITCKVSRQGQVVGVLLASLKFDFIKKLVNQVPIKEGFIEVKQDRTLLAKTGNIDDKTEADDKFSIPHSEWDIYFWSANENAISAISLIISAIFLSALIACLAFFIGYRKLTEYLTQDQSSIINAAKDMMAGKNAGNYPVQLKEMNPIVSILAQYKRVIDKQQKGEFDTRDQLDGKVGGDRLSFRDTGERVVISEGDRRQAYRCGLLHHDARWVGPVRCVRVQVEVDGQGVRLRR